MAQIKGVTIKKLITHSDEKRIPFDDPEINFDWRTKNK